MRGLRCAFLFPTSSRSCQSAGVKDTPLSTSARARTVIELALQLVYDHGFQSQLSAIMAERLRRDDATSRQRRLTAGSTDQAKPPQPLAECRTKGVQLGKILEANINLVLERRMAARRNDPAGRDQWRRSHSIIRRAEHPAAILNGPHAGDQQVLLAGRAATVPAVIRNVDQQFGTVRR